MRPEQRGWAKRLSSTSNWQQEETLAATKPFDIPKLWVAKAFQVVKANGGAAGVDGVSLEAFERSLEDNLYKLWNRMASGSYVPPPVKAVIIPKKDGGERVLGVPTVADRVAQMVVKMAFEPNVEPVFLADSYGYRPGKSALDAVRVTRERCWKYDWVLEFDIKGLFDLACWCPPQQADRGSKVRRSNLPALSFRNALSVRGTSGNRYNPVWASSVMAIVPLWMRS